MFLNERLEERKTKLQIEADLMHEKSEWTDEMKAREIEIYKELDYLHEVGMRWDSLCFTADDHISASMRAYTK